MTIATGEGAWQLDIVHDLVHTSVDGKYIHFFQPQMPPYNFYGADRGLCPPLFLFYRERKGLYWWRTGTTLEPGHDDHQDDLQLVHGLRPFLFARLLTVLV